jgi:integrase
MKPLRQRMTEDLQLRNRSPRTIETYISHVERFAKFHERSPDLLGLEEVRAYQMHLLKAGASWSLFNQAVCALKFFYSVTLRVDWLVTHIPYGRRPKKLPIVLSQDELVRLLVAVDKRIYRMALMTAYAAGLRITELVALKPEHIDSARMMLLVELGKGQKSRLVPLSDVLLAQLRDYWRTDRPRVKGSPWRLLVPTQSDPVSPPPITITCLPSARNWPLSLSPALTLFCCGKNSMAKWMPSSSRPGTGKSRDCSEPPVSNTASKSFCNLVAEMVSLAQLVTLVSLGISPINTPVRMFTPSCVN